MSHVNNINSLEVSQAPRTLQIDVSPEQGQQRSAVDRLAFRMLESAIDDHDAVFYFSVDCRRILNQLNIEPDPFVGDWFSSGCLTMVEYIAKNPRLGELWEQAGNLQIETILKHRLVPSVKKSSFAEDKESRYVGIDRIDGRRGNGGRKAIRHGGADSQCLAMMRAKE